MDQNKLKHLIEKYLNNTISKSELEELMVLLNFSNLDEVSKMIDLEVENSEKLNNTLVFFDQNKGYKQLQKELEVDRFKAKKFVNIKLLTGIAASILLIVGICFKYVIPVQTAEKALLEDVVLPDENLATITLANGKEIPLIYAQKELLGKEGIELLADADSGIVFKVNKIIDKHLVNRTIKASKGMCSKVILADGSVVLLNSGSSLTYPSVFSNSERSVCIEGEAFFDVTHLENQPFVVSANNTKIKVLGTSFNIATNIIDNKVLTTLVKGSVEVITSKSKTVISPGIQSVSDNNSGEMVQKSVQLKDVLAWKDGHFYFNEDDIISVLDKIKNWYEISDYEIQGLSKDHFAGSVRRTQKLSELLKQLEKISSYKFKIVGRRVIVMS